ncbi:hypothetical protein ACHAWT_009653 [Skeletonema menzelii]|eukprot:scaffold743_cov145-Skeletonema_menzelii.AAC.21
MTETINPLTNSQKLFLQRLLVAHVLTDEKAKDLYRSIQEKFAKVNNDDDETSGDEDDDVDQGYMGNDFEHCLGIINASLMPAFNLEIGTVSLPAAYNPDGDKNTNKLSQGGEEDGARKPSSSSSLVKYHAIVNRSNDDVAKNYAAARTALGPHEIAYFRKVLEKLVECGNEVLETQQQQQGGRKRNRLPVVGCVGALNKMDLINLRTELEGPHQDKLSIAQTEMALEIMESEGWLVPAAPPGEEDEDDDNRNFDNDEDDEQPKKRKRKPSRKSLRGAFFSIGPRTFMELTEFLQKCGFPEERMPQSILHRS